MRRIGAGTNVPALWRHRRPGHLRGRRRNAGAFAGTGTLQTEPPPKVWQGFVLRCRGGPFADNPEAFWWTARHRPGCTDTWQPSAPGTAASANGGSRLISLLAWLRGKIF